MNDDKLHETSVCRSEVVKVWVKVLESLEIIAVCSKLAFGF